MKKWLGNILWFIALILVANGVLEIREYGFSIVGWLLLAIGIFYLYWDKFMMKEVHIIEKK